MPDMIRPGYQSDEVSEIGDLLELLDSRPAFHADAACREPHPGVSFFPARGETVAPAKAICCRCLARPDCLAWALAQGGDLHGIFGGTSQKERGVLRAGRREKPAATAGHLSVALFA